VVPHLQTVAAQIVLLVLVLQSFFEGHHLTVDDGFNGPRCRLHLHFIGRTARETTCSLLILSWPLGWFGRAEFGGEDEISAHFVSLLLPFKQE